jgi:alkaline phosphatase
MPHVVEMLTSSESDVVTDSAASASAMATGEKTKNRALSVDEDGKPRPTVAELAKKSGKALGFVTTSFVLDATPAAFFAHVEDRDAFQPVSESLLELAPEVIYGGGEDAFLPKGRNGKFGEGKRTDNRDLIADFQRKGYNVVAQPSGDKGRHLGLFASKEMFVEEPPYFNPPVTLPAMAKAALSVLDRSRSGFFLLLEEEGTDAMSHGNSVTYAVDAARFWNQTVGLALDYQKRHPETSVIVLSDHETGGFNIYKAKDCKDRVKLNTREGKPFCAGFSTHEHTAQPVVIYSSGVASHRAVVQNTDVYDLIKKGLGLP